MSGNNYYVELIDFNTFKAVKSDSKWVQRVKKANKFLKKINEEYLMKIFFKLSKFRKGRLEFYQNKQTFILTAAILNNAQFCFIAAR